jgi:hypothetical protein
LGSRSLPCFNRERDCERGVEFLQDTKTHAERRIALDPETVDELTHHLDRSEERAAAAQVSLTDDAFVFSPVIDGSRPWRPGGVSLAFISDP